GDLNWEATGEAVYRTSGETHDEWGRPLIQSFPWRSLTTYDYWDASKYFQKKSVTQATSATWNSTANTFAVTSGVTTRWDYATRGDTRPGYKGNVLWVRDARYANTSRQYEFAYNEYGQKVE